MAQVPTPTVGATAEVRDATNRVVATADFHEGHGEVIVTITFGNPPVLSGTHAIHINDTGRCDPPDFASSGNIFNPYNKKHGRQNPEGFEVGDLPNVNFSNGLTSYNTTAVGGTLGTGANSLLSPNRSLVIFSGEDDQNTAPEGNAGTRIACGVITAAGAAATGPLAGAAGALPTITPTPASAPAVPRIASPVPAPAQGQVAAQGAPGQPAAGQPAAGQPAAGQPAVRPANSPVVQKPAVVVNPSSSPSPVVAAPAGAPPAAPTPVVVPTSPPLASAPQTVQTSASSGGGLAGMTALIIAVLGVGLVGAGYLLRRRSQLQNRL